MKLPIVLSCVLVLSACASPAQKDAGTAARTEAAQAEQPQCLRETGSHIARNENRPCAGGPGETYTREDIDRTGATTTADALRRLSPSVR